MSSSLNLYSYKGLFKQKENVVVYTETKYFIDNCSKQHATDTNFKKNSIWFLIYIHI